MDLKALRIVCASSLLLASGQSLAETYLCVAEKAAGVRNWGTERIEAYTMHPEPLRYILTNKSGDWVVKGMGNSKVVSKCESEYLCRDGAIEFFREDSGLFTVNAFFSDGEKEDAVVGKGLCTSIE